ncbi:MAG: 23S rRNA (uracil(1939)-C(5))-methyltransferase RlmD [Saprospiraceae bacterium]|nr:23S rRNA (uracil(1939)-C(5))-methyltransferase RlmD [Saprospiraceae bacterium]
MPRRRQRVEQVTFSGMAHKGQAIGRTEEGMVVFAQGAVPGDKAMVRLLRKRKGTWQGHVEELLFPSPHRTEPACQHFGVCGGCKWQNYAYLQQLKEKEQSVHDSMQRIAGLDSIPLLPILGADPVYQYRNKLEYSFSAKRWRTREEIETSGTFSEEGALGLHPPGNFQKVVELETCWLQQELTNDIRNFVGDFARKNAYSFFDPLQHTGFLRNMILRNTLAGEWMVVLSFAYEDEARRIALLDALADRFEDIVSLHYVINEKKNDTLFDQEIICYQGAPTIVESLDNLHFQIRPKSFFQTNTRQAKVLYDQVRFLTDIQQEDVVYDLYCGLGSITLYLARDCHQIVGIEEVEDAIKDAHINAANNGVANARFFCGDVRNLLGDEDFLKLPKPDIVITDPPRAGMHEEVVEQLIGLAPRQIVYVSCNPATQARDIKLMSGHYRVEQLQPVDMFPHTAHIENIASLRRI